MLVISTSDTILHFANKLMEIDGTNIMIQKLNRLEDKELSLEMLIFCFTTKKKVNDNAYFYL